MKNIRLSSQSRKFLLKADKILATKISNKIKALVDYPESLEIKKMKGTKGIFRIRTGDYRIIFEIQDETILIVKIGNRKDIYK